MRKVRTKTVQCFAHKKDESDYDLIFGADRCLNCFSREVSE